MTRRVSFLAVMLLVVQVAVIGLTRRDPLRRNLRFFNGMVESPASGSQSANAALAGGVTEREPVPGTIARGHMPSPYGPSPQDRDAARFRLNSPIEATPESVARGKQVYGDYCIQCHGPRAMGYGEVGRRASLGMSLLDQITVDRRDGELYHIIKYGRLLMPAHGRLIGSDEDIWHVINYLRRVQEDAP